MHSNTFDIYAPAYDRHFTSSVIGRLQRDRVYRFFVPLLQAQMRVLELNCGTGHDACQLADLSREYLATDISAEMIAQCEQKGSMTGKLRFKRMPIQESGENLKQRQMVFSNFGGFNCLSPDELHDFFRQCDRHLDQHASLFLVVMGRTCVWETVYFILKRKWRTAFRRRSRSGVATELTGAKFSTWYYSPADIAGLAGSNYKVVSKRPIGLFLPPSYLEPFFGNKRTVLSFLSGLERIFACSVFSDLGDHYYIHLKKIR